MVKGTIKPDTMGSTKQTTDTGVKESANIVKPAKIKPDKKPDNGLVDIDELAKVKDLPWWEKAAFFRAASWAPGKKVTEKAFDQGLKRFQERHLGSGKI